MIASLRNGNGEACAHGVGTNFLIQPVKIRQNKSNLWRPSRTISWIRMPPDSHVAYIQYWAQYTRWENGQLTSSNSLTSTTHETGWQQYVTKSRKQWAWDGASVVSVTSNGTDGQLPPARNVPKITSWRHHLARLALSRAEVKASEPSVIAAMENVKEKERKSKILRKQKLWKKTKTQDTSDTFSLTQRTVRA